MTSEASDVTVVICARDAAATITRAVRSAVAQGGPVVVVDDYSRDGTAAIARQAGGDVVTIVRPDGHRTLGHARQTGVAAVQTPWLQWLDADDELVEGRGCRLQGRARSEGWDAVWDAADLLDGPSGGFVRHLPMPAFMSRPNAAVRLFERNHLPGPAWPLVRTAFARAVGYDPALPTADDLDFLLRGVRAGGRFGFVSASGYVQYAYPGSLSRNRVHQGTWVAAALAKHPYAEVRERYRAAGWPDGIADWALVTMATFRHEWEAALGFLARLVPVDDDLVLEPDGPWPVREGWRRAFHLGTLHLLDGRAAPAMAALDQAAACEATAETVNNLGVALHRLGDHLAAARCFAAALRRRPDFADARANLGAARPSAITMHPLRRSPSRSEYAA